MNDYQDEEALARLRAADPATGAHPDLHRISQRLRGRTPLGSQSAGGYATSTGYSFSDTSETAVRVNDPASRTSRVGFVVAASVAALAFGGGGYVAGVASSGDDRDGSTTVASTDEEQERRDVADAAEDMASSEDMAASEEMAASEGGVYGDDGMGGGYAGPVVPVAGEGLSTERTTGPVFAADDSDGAPDPGEVLEEYAGALGIEGTVESDPYSAYVTDTTDGRNLHVYVQGSMASIDYSDPALDPYCQEYMSEPGGGWFGEEGPESITCLPPGEAPEEGTAIALAQEFADTLGIDDAGYEFRADNFDPMIAYGEGYEELLDESGATSAPDADAGTDGTGDAAEATAVPDAMVQDYLEEWGSQFSNEDVRDVSVTAERTDSPMPSYRSWYFGVTDQGVAYASFQLGDLVPMGDYEVISPAEAVDRVNDTRFQQIGAYIPDLEMEATYDEDWTEPEPLPPLVAGEPIPYPLSESQVTAAELHSGVVSLWDGTEFVAPVYHLTDDRGNSWQVLGLAEEALDFTP
ncbi:hypothetical protein MWU75_01945 [Ornithinimicrobium sp. F0845]|uniref:hypothetical protein n=1 Tax=Ornithinimicrobium sp. F0845 TaxID=2926412 RepID=UPI001FF6EDC2|nr:hypothetical protein [Ornithinimicrobium sp. F0845]MCK0110906.1 hypothetical protein [Ornithinimicrobium sp. F0845]